MEDVLNAETTAATRIIIFIKHTLRTDNTLYNHKATVVTYNWKYYFRMAVPEKKIRYDYTKFSIFLFLGDALCRILEN